MSGKSLLTHVAHVQRHREQGLPTAGGDFILHRFHFVSNIVLYSRWTISISFKNSQPKFILFCFTLNNILLQVREAVKIFVCVKLFTNPRWQLLFHSFLCRNSPLNVGWEFNFQSWPHCHFPKVGKKTEFSCPTATCWEKYRFYFILTASPRPRKVLNKSSPEMELPLDTETNI